VGYDRKGLPIGMHLLGDSWQEHRLLRIAAAIESFTERRTPPDANFVDVLSRWK
jgi:Asp-tRNA(Asn)/Glu-tRNA(Gln) amidotransferase A subunit family amidase